MRPPAQSSSFFYHPLDSILGTPAAVRILRLLSSHKGGMSRAQIAEATGLGRAGAGRALDRLVAVRIVQASGDPARPHFTLADGALVDGLKTLFEAEVDRNARFFKRLRKGAAAIDPPPDALWVVGSVARREDTPESEIELVLLWKSGLGPKLKEFAESMAAASAKFGVRVIWSRLSLGELEAHAMAGDDRWRGLRDAVQVVGPSPAELVADASQIARN